MLAFLNKEDKENGIEYEHINDIDEFNYEVAIGNIPPQKIVISKEYVDVIDFLKGSGFEVSSEVIKKEVSKKVKEDIIEKPRKESINTNNNPSKDTTVIKKESKNDTKLAKTKMFKLPSIFKRKKEDKVEVNLMGDEALNIGNLTVDLSDGKQFRRFLIQNGYLTNEECANIDNVMSREKSIGRDPKIIEVARREGILDEKTAAICLTHATRCEISNPESLNIQNLITINDGLINKGNNFFYVDANEEDKTVTVGSDYSTEPGWHLIEGQFVNHKIKELKFVEGVTSEIVSRINNIASSGI